jgi:hypothetical protein
VLQSLWKNIIECDKFELVSTVTELPQHLSQTLSSNVPPAIDSAALAWACRVTPEFTGKRTDPVVLETERLPPVHNHYRSVVNAAI